MRAFRALRGGLLAHCEERVYRRAEIEQHDSVEKRVWVTYKDGVYDITDFLEEHPGGVGKLLLAAGKQIDPFWRVYQQHFRAGSAALEILGRYRIGQLDPQDVVQVDASDPYNDDPERHPGLTFHATKPCNAEIPNSLMLDKWLTPNAIWFIRHHHPVPAIPDDFCVEVGGTGVKAIRLSVEDLCTRFPQVDVTTTIQCGGNRRSGFDSIKKTTGISWSCGAISTAAFRGAALRDVLMYSGMLTPDIAEAKGVRHIIFEGIDGTQASIPIEKALDPYGDVLIAHSMNGDKLPREHGWPLRVVVPGVVGIRNIKWVHRIRASPEEADGPWQRGIAYKGFAPNLDSAADLDLDKILSIQETPVQSVIVSPEENEKVELDDVTVRGFAYSGGGRGIVRVDVSLDGEHWTTAELLDGSEQNPRRAWAWTFFEASIEVPEHMKGKVLEVMCKATDSSYNCQPECAKPIWNLRGLNNNSWHRVHFQHVD